MVIFFATPELLTHATETSGNAWCHGFGSTEQGAPTTRLTAEDAQASRRVLTAWSPRLTIFEMAIMDEQGERLPAGQIGEIVVRSAMSAGTYWNSADKTDQAFFPGGWFRPNDIGYIDDDGFLYYLDRAKDRITTAAGVVYPHVVEAVLLRHPSVSNCGVVGLGAAGKQSVVAAVIVKDGAAGTPAVASEILELAAASLPDHAHPERIVFVATLPRFSAAPRCNAKCCKRVLSETAVAA